MQDNPIKIQAWPEVKSEVKKLHPRLADAIDESQLHATADFVRATYAYGQLIMKNGELQLPISATKTIAFEAENIPAIIKTRLHDCAPIGIILNQAAELFYEPNIEYPPIDKHIFSERVFEKGDLIGINEFFDATIDPNRQTPNNRHLSAGARTLFMLPKVSDYNSHYKFKKRLKIESHSPMTIWDQHSIFKEIATSNITKKPWTIDILFFSKSWWSKKNQKATEDIKNLLLQQAWQQSYYLRNTMQAEAAWSLLVDVNKALLKKQHPILVYAIKKLLKIQAGITPGYKPLLDNKLGPIDLLQQAYIEIYKTNYYPTILGPSQLTVLNPLVYYSSHLPSLEYKNFSKQSRKTEKLDFCELVGLMNHLSYPDEIKNKFTYFHPKEYTSASGLIKSIEDLLAFDRRFLPPEGTLATHLNVTNSAPFFKGCIQISY